MALALGSTGVTRMALAQGSSRWPMALKSAGGSSVIMSSLGPSVNAKGNSTASANGTGGHLSPLQWLTALWPRSVGSNSSLQSPSPSDMQRYSATPVVASESSGEVEGEEEAAVEECEVVQGRDVILGVDAHLGKVDDEKNFSGYLVQPMKNFNGMAVLLLPDVMGHRNAEIRDFALRVSCHGYCVLVPDLFRGSPWNKSRPEAEYEQWRAEKAGPSERVAQDISTAATFLESHVRDLGQGCGESDAPACALPPKLAILGFCFGGGRALEALARDGREGTNIFSTGVSFYGTRVEPAQVAPDIKVPVLMVSGDSDPLVSIADMEALAREVPGSKTMVFPGRGHAFVHRPQNLDEDEDSEKAFQAAKHWLHEHLLGSL